MKKSLGLILIALLVISLISGCGAQSTANSFNDYFSKVSKNIEALKETNDQFSKIASNANSVNDLKGADKILNRQRQLLVNVLKQYQTTKPPKELKEYRDKVVKNLKDKISLVEMLNQIVGYVNNGDLKNPQVQSILAKMPELQTKISNNDRENSVLLSKIAKDNKLVIKSSGEKVEFEPAK